MTSGPRLTHSSVSAEAPFGTAQAGTCNRSHRCGNQVPSPPPPAPALLLVVNFAGREVKADELASLFADMRRPEDDPQRLQDSLSSGTVRHSPFRQLQGAVRNLTQAHIRMCNVCVGTAGICEPALPGVHNIFYRRSASYADQMGAIAVE